MGTWGIGKRLGALRAQLTKHGATCFVTALCIGALVAHALACLPYFPDDSYISLRYAKRLANGSGLTWTDGERVEGYSNLLWVLLISAVGFFAKGFVVTARVVGVVCAAASIAAVFWAHRVTRPARALSGLFGGLAIASSGAVAAYAIAGLEQPLIAALLAWSLVLTYPTVDESARGQPWAAAIAFGLLAVTRADGLLFGVGAAFALIVALGVRRAWKPALTLLTVTAAFVAAQLAFRLAYYDAWVPNTYHAKVAFTEQRLREGLKYLDTALPLLTGLLVMAAAAFVVSSFDRRVRRRAILLATVALTWSAYLVAIGGDFFWQHRHIVPLVPVLALLGAEFIAWALSRRRWQWALGWGLSGAALVHLADAARKDPQHQHAKNDRWHFGGRQVGAFLRYAFTEQRPLLAVDAAGCLPFFYQLPALDMLGLTDRHIASHPPPGFGSGFLGHELGDGKYVLSRKPDLIAFWTPLGSDRAPWLGGQQMQADPSFYQLYQAVTFDTFDGIRARIWVRKDGRVGIQRSDQELLVPGFLLSRHADSVARLDDEGNLGVTIIDGVPAELDGLNVSRGIWRVRFRASGPILAAISAQEPGASNARGPDELFLMVSGENESVNLRVSAAPGATAHLRSVQFTRLEPSALRE
jgi:arabinofuranosyltransferase